MFAKIDNDSFARNLLCEDSTWDHFTCTLPLDNIALTNLSNDNQHKNLDILTIKLKNNEQKSINIMNKDVLLKEFLTFLNQEIK